MPIGYSDLKNVLRLPSAWDLTYMKKWALKDGVTFDQMVRRVGTALVLFNRSLSAGYWGQYFSTTTDLETEYDVGGESAELSLISEYGRPDPVHGEFTGHMIPLKDYGGSLGWTYLVLRRAKSSRMDRDIKRLIERSQNTWERKFMGRLFTSVAETVGTSGKSVPFADGGTADADFIPPTYDGKVFAYTHNHFLRYAADAAGRTAAMQAMADHLREHGIPAPWDLVVSEADVALWAAQTEFKKPERGILSTAGVEVRATVPEETYFGILEVNRGWFRVKSSNRLPTAYAGAFKPYGFGNTNNPLVVRYEEGYPLGLTLVGEIDQFPLQEAIAYFTFGVGVANRLAGVATYFAGAGNYVDPTIT